MVLCCSKCVNKCEKHESFNRDKKELIISYCNFKRTNNCKK